MPLPTIRNIWPQPSGPTNPPDRPHPPGQPLPPPGAPGSTGCWTAAALVAALLLRGESAMAAAGAGGGLPYSSWLTTFRQSVSGEIALTIAVVCIVAGVGGWVAGGEMTGMLMYLVRAVAGLAIVIGAVAFIGTISTSGATLPLVRLLPL